LHFTVAPGMYGCFKGFVSDDVTLTYRQGSPGAEGGNWEEFPTDETAISGEFVVVGTTTYPDGVFTIDVNDVNAEGECEEEQEEIDAPDLPCLAECGPSGYYAYFQMLAQWFKEMVNAMASEESAEGG
ncbi:MAG: hypothetical protein R3246_09245, partial [Acidimicrobiia bacterium]|nr:hypothetical protein [Acidimicrobiia bacterium]